MPGVLTSLSAECSALLCYLMTSGASPLIRPRYFRDLVQRHCRHYTDLAVFRWATGAHSQHRLNHASGPCHCTCPPSPVPGVRVFVPTRRGRRTKNCLSCGDYGLLSAVNRDTVSGYCAVGISADLGAPFTLDRRPKSTWPNAYLSWRGY